MDQKTLKQFEQLISNALRNVASKDDLKNFATKDDLKHFATKDDLKNFATKDDLTAMEKRFENKFATKVDLVKLSRELKNELIIVKDELLAKIEDVDNGVMVLLKSTDDHKADRKEFDTLRKRVEKLERKVFTN